MPEQLEFDFTKVQGNHNTAYVPMNDLENLAQTILNLKSTIDALKEANSVTTDELKDVDKIMPLMDKVVNSDVYTEQEKNKVTSFITTYMLERYGV